MRKLLMVAAVALLPFTAQAQLSLGLRVGYAPAMGDAYQDAELKDGIESQIPIQVDAMYEVTPEIAVGPYFSYGFGQAGDLGGLCDLAGVDCSANIMRLGVQGTYTFSKVSQQFVPWAGAGFGYEWASLEAEDDFDSVEFKYSGFEFLNLQVGGDYKVNERFSVGPYLQFSIGQYSSAEETNTVDPSLNFDGDIEDKATHEWLGFGLRGKFDL